MSAGYKPMRVSDAAAKRLESTHSYYEKSHYRDAAMTAFIAAIHAEMGDVHHCNTAANTSVIYRPTDIHVLGEIGYRDMRLRKVGGEKPLLYIRGYNIKNSKIGVSYWQHNTYSHASLKRMVSLAVEHLKPLPAEQSAKLCGSEAKLLFDEALRGVSYPMHRLSKDFFGEPFYSGDFDSKLIAELRDVTFKSPGLVAAAAAFYTGLDKLIAMQRSLSTNMYYVALADNYGQQVIDIVPYAEDGMFSSGSRRIPMHRMPEWIHRRLAVIQMVAPNTYIQDVGLRLDDRVFFIVGDEVNAE